MLPDGDLAKKTEEAEKSRLEGVRAALAPKEVRGWWRLGVGGGWGLMAAGG